ncbi:Exodeoxyribonuclease VIII [Labilithrix luteola]|uniref:Exodeoxyribonuclease VIII n=1 Tax=Labilithrix luteola TaxID=1391654 RepID=A0A0K1QBP3_9BACT|nr:PD-(D/E)XK nuclease-like domain-containing protein [Labilithrix luteola]AKV03169.1 Exodeoxyribonuclease VIII [Labilithrix luteola]
MTSVVTSGAAYADFDFAHAATGIYRGMPADIYHARAPGVVSKTVLDILERSAAHYKAWLDGHERPATDALELGVITHARVFEPDLFASTYVQAPDHGDQRFKENKQKKAEWKAANEGKKPVSEEHWIASEGMARSIRRHPKVAPLLSRGEAEVTARWEDLDTGIICKARADWLVPNLGIILDLKTTEDAREDAFARSCAKYRYHVQNAHYDHGFSMAGIEIEDFVFVAVEKQPPYACAVYTLDDEAVFKGREAVDRNLRSLRDCIEVDEWPAYGNGIKKLSLPRWA